MRKTETQPSGLTVVRRSVSPPKRVAVMRRSESPPDPPRTTVVRQEVSTSRAAPGGRRVVLADDGKCRINEIFDIVSNLQYCKAL